MKRLAIGGVLLGLVTAPVAAHDFWIQPSRYSVGPAVPVAVNFFVGHGSARQRWGLGSDRIVTIADVSRGVRRDQRQYLRSDGTTDLLTSFPNEGIHTLVLQSDFALSNLPAIRFNDYAKTEGLTPILAARARAGESSSAGREKYSRRAKALVQVGKATAANQAIATRPLGLKLEIVPDRNPYALGKTRMLPVHVLYNGRRLANATVKLTRLEADERPVAIAVTDASGRATFRVPPVGTWLLNVVWAEALKGDPKADFETTFSSLTFGYGSVRQGR